jgi:hypothetical protein
MGHSDLDPAVHQKHPWNAGILVGAERPLKPRAVWAIRFFLDEHRRPRDRALFDPAIDSKLRGCDIVKITIGDLVSTRQYAPLVNTGAGVRVPMARGRLQPRPLVGWGRLLLDIKPA